MAWTEELGFDRIWLTEHHFSEYGPGLPALPAAGGDADAAGARRPRASYCRSTIRSASPKSWRWWTS